MKLKGIELKGTYKVICYATCFVVYDEKGNQIYFEDSNGYWSKREYDEKGNVIYHEDSNGYWDKWDYNEKGNVIYCEDSNGYWAKTEYDEKGNEIYYESSNGEIFDKRIKELTIEEIEKIKTDYSIRDLENTAEKQLEDIFILKRMSIEEIEVKLNCFFRLKKTEYYIKHYIETGCTDNYMEIMFDIGRFAYTINIYYLDTHEEEKKYITEVSVAIEIDL